ncbi:hypothetical protein GNZ24_14095 [Burkholderia thailandensis]|nr:hypothetical protein [Burkholderia thailandensis]MUV28135.1 hypothetical protein [Burkholderia thailandensis]NBD05077.1 hypothetical protein [Burkholderia thailandensis]
MVVFTSTIYSAAVGNGRGAHARRRARASLLRIAPPLRHRIDRRMRAAAHALRPCNGRRPARAPRMDVRSCGAHYLRYRSRFAVRTFLQWLHGARFDPPTGM